MTVFGCVGCDAVLSAPLSQVALPVHAHQTWGHALLPVLMEPGTYAVDPAPSGPPRRRWSEIGADEAAARGVFAPVSALSFGASGAIVVAPGDTRGMVLILERCEGYCCGLDGSGGPNLACEQCGRAVATRIDDCSFWQSVWLAPDAVHALSTDEPADRALDWEAVTGERRGPAPIDQSGHFGPGWEAAIGSGLAHLLAASSGAPVTLPNGLIADLFGPALAILLPAGAPAKTVGLAGPDLPVPEAGPDILVVPRHPRTGEPWQPSSTARTVPLPADVWAHLAFSAERPLVHTTARLPDGALRDDPSPLLPASSFRPDWAIFLHTLARLPAVRQPWLRKIYDRVQSRPYAHPF